MTHDRVRALSGPDKSELDKAIDQLIRVGMGAKDVVTDEIREAWRKFVEVATSG